MPYTCDSETTQSPRHIETMDTDNLIQKLENNSIMDLLNNLTLGAGERPYPHLAQEVMMWTLPLLMVSLNILVFIVAPRMNAINPCTAYGMLSLAAADFSLGIVHVVRMSYNTYSHYRLESDQPICLIDGYGQPLFASISIITLTFMNLDRLLTMAFPLHYPTYLTRKKVISVHVTIWLLMIILFAPTVPGILGTSIKYYPDAFMCVANWAGSLPYNIVVLILVQIIPTTVIAICFAGIFYFARTRDKHMKGGGGEGSSRVQVHRGGGASSNEDSQWKKDMRIFKTLAIMTFGFLLAWSPYFITVAIPEMITGNSLHPITDFITPWLGASNSFWNPIIYIPTMRPFYMATVQLLRALPCVKVQEEVEGRALSLSANSATNMSTAASNSAIESKKGSVSHSV